VIAVHTSVAIRTKDLHKAIPMLRCRRKAIDIREHAMFVDRIQSPRCPKCGAMMSLRIIEPERQGFDLRTFECPKCYDTETFVASISHELNVSTGPSLAGA
jgi:transposase-like protein